MFVQLSLSIKCMHDLFFSTFAFDRNGTELDDACARASNRARWNGHVSHLRSVVERRPRRLYVKPYLTSRNARL